MALRLNGATSGYVELDAPATAGSNTLVLPNGNGTSGQYLQTDGLGALSWQSIGDTGKVLQVVENSTASTASTTSTSWQDSSLSGSITPSSTSSKILIMMNAHIATSQSSTNAAGGYNICRGSTIIWYPRSSNADGTSPIEIFPSFGNVTSIYLPNRIAVQMIDEPATTSEVTYKVQLASANVSCTVTMNGTAAGHNSNSRFVLMEIAG